MESKTLAAKIRRHAVEMTEKSGASHIGAVLSVADIIAVLYAEVLRYNIDDCLDINRDYLILSKGHAGIAVYSALAEVGFFSLDKLDEYYSNGGVLSGHISHKNVPGVEISTGSLGHGFSVGCGISLVCAKEKRENKIYVILGDGECNEGSIWEAAMFANHYNLFNLIVIVDSNKMQAMGMCEDVMSLSPLMDKWKSFGFNVIEVDGHSHSELISACNKKYENKKPKCIIAHTIKGKGISFMENNLIWHYRNPSGENYLAAIKELERGSENEE